MPNLIFKITNFNLEAIEEIEQIYLLNLKKEKNKLMILMYFIMQIIQKNLLNIK